MRAMNKLRTKTQDIHCTVIVSTLIDTFQWQLKVTFHAKSQIDWGQTNVNIDCSNIVHSEMVCTRPRLWPPKVSVVRKGSQEEVITFPPLKVFSFHNLCRDCVLSHSSPTGIVNSFNGQITPRKNPLEMKFSSLIFLRNWELSPVPWG